MAETSKKEIGKYLEDVLKRKEQYLNENAQYRKHESMYHRHVAGKYIGDFIYGANDGIITTFAVIAGSFGASLAPIVIIILGFANLLADGLSMGASNFLGKKSEQDYARAQRQKEEWEIEHLREIEVEEIREIYERKGFVGKDLERAVEIITSDRKIWLDTMMRDELNIIEETDNDPVRHGFATFASFLVAGLFPLLPYLVPNVPSPFLLSILVGGITLFFLGSLRSLVTTVSWIKGGLEVLAIGSTAAMAAFWVGKIIEGFVR